MKDERELLALWQLARQEASRRCGHTLARLRAGEGGFYEAEDFWQDLFLAFWKLFQSWWESGKGEGALWAAWRRFLHRGGAQILRRAPMRLWGRRERTLPPQLLALEEDQGELDQPLDPLALAALTQAEDAEAEQYRQACLDDLEAALWALRPAQRQVIFMATLAELPAAEVARLLGLSGANAIFQRLHGARLALRRLLR